MIPMRSNRAVLRRMCSDLGITKRSKIAELGCYYGESTVEFARCAGTVYAIDSWEESYQRHPDMKGRAAICPEAMASVEGVFDRNARDHHNIEKLKMRHEAAVGTFQDGALDMVYIDIVHTEEATREAIQIWMRKVRVGGWVAGHDLTPAFPGVRRAVFSTKPEATPLRMWDDGNWAFLR